MSQSSSKIQIIVEIEQEIIAIVGRAVTCEKARKIGDLLAQAKVSLPHGQYMGWIENELPKVADISYQTANKYSAVRDWLQSDKMSMARELLNNALFSHVYPLYVGIKGAEKGTDNEVESLSARSQSLLHLYHRNQSHLTVTLVERLVKIYKKQPQLFDKISLINGDEEILREILNRSSSEKFLQALDGYLADDLHLTRDHLQQIDANLDLEEAKAEPKGDRAVTSCASCTFFDRQGALPGVTSMLGRCNKFHKELNLSDLDHGLNCEKWVRRDEVEAATEKSDKVEKLEREEAEEIETVGPATQAMGAALVQRKEGETRTVNVRDRLHRNIEKYVVTDKTQLVAEAEKLGICELIALAVLYRASLEGCELTISEVKKRIQNIQWIDQ